MGLMLILACTSPAAAQQDPLSEEEFPELKKRLEKTTARHLSGLLKEKPRPSNMAAFRKLFTAPGNRRSRSARRTILRAKRSEELRELGLSLDGGYTENLEQGAFNAEGIFYKRRASLELEWDVLKGGLMDHRYEAEELSNKLKIARHTQRDDEREARYSRRYNRIIHLFNRQKIPLLEKRRALIKDLLDVTTRLYEADYVPWKQVLDLTSQRAQVKIRLNNYRTYNEQFAWAQSASIRPSRLPIVDVAVERLDQAMRTSRPLDSLLALRLENMRLENHPLRQISLSPHLRYNAYHSPGSADQPLREYFSAGLSFSVPLPLRFGANERIARAKRRTTRREARRRDYNTRKEVYNTYYQYKYHLEQYVEFYQKRLRLRHQIQQERNRKKLKEPGYSPVKALSLGNRLLDVRVELVDIQQKMYLTLLKLARRLEPGRLPALVEPARPADMLTPDFAQTAYVWSSTFADYENALLLDALPRHNISQVLLSLGGREALMDKGRTFIEQAQSRDLSVHLMIGSNALIYPRNADRLRELVASAERLNADGIHLDVEPHTFDDWDANRASYLSKYVDMLETARALADEAGLEVSVSVPVYYDKPALTDIFRLSDRVHIMAYANPDVDDVRRKISDEVALDADKVSIALRTQDFDTLPALRAFQNALADATPVERFSVHDLAGLFSLDDDQAPRAP